MTKWTQFMDMHSGGGQKLDWAYIYIEAPEDEAKIIFYNRFGRNPDRVTCTCCGPDYSLTESDSLQRATAFERNCDPAYFDADGNEIPTTEAFIAPKGYATWRYVERPKKYFNSSSSHTTLEDYLKNPRALFIYANEIKDSERSGYLPDEGYIWAGG